MGQVNVVSASAGSGKTYNMAYSYILTLIDQPTRYRNLLAVTFTNKATDELKQRILQHLNGLSQGANGDFEAKLMHDLRLDSATIRSRAAEARNYILHDYNNFSILTIDKFFQRVMRAFIKELGKDLNFNLELQTDTLLGQAADRMLDELSTDEQLRQWVMALIGENIEEGASWNIKGTLTTLGKELFREEYRSAAISTKDKAELQKIVASANATAKQQVEQFKALGGEFVAAMNREGLLASDFKGGSRSFVNYVQKVAAGIVDAPSSAATKAAADTNEWYTAKSPRRGDIESFAQRLRPTLERIVATYPAVAKADNTAALLTSKYREFALLADLRDRIDTLCKEEGILPISDVNDLITKLIADNDAPFIYEKVGNKFSHFMIDEFQDTSRGQWDNFVPLLHNAISQEEGAPVMLVGDVKQSIYRWRGGDWSLLARDVNNTFEKVHNSSLLKNYRSSEQVVRFNNKLIEHSVERVAEMINGSFPADSTLLSSSLAAQLGNTTREAYSDFVQKPKDTTGSGYVTMLEYENDQEVHPVVHRIEDLQRRGFKAKDIAILVRRNSEAKEMATILLNHKTQHPESPYVYDIVTQDALEVGSSPDVRFVVALLSLATNPADTLARATYNDHFGYPFEQPIDAKQSDFIHSLSLMQPEEAFNEIMLHYAEEFSEHSVPYLQALHNSIISYCSRKVADTALWLQWWNESGSTKSIVLPSEADAISIVTIHKSKGLGFQAVVIPYCDWTMSPKSNAIYWGSPNAPLSNQITKFPLPFSAKMAQSAFSESYYNEITMSYIDSLNMLYVAVTRAISELHIMVPTSPGDKSVGSLTLGAVSALTPTDSAEFGGKLYEFGEAADYVPKKSRADEQRILSESRFTTFSPVGKIAVSYDHQRYDSDSSGEQLSPREHGTLLHRCFEQATTLDDIYAAVEQAVVDGNISATEGDSLRHTIEQTLAQHSEIGEWFDGSWEEVLNEREIISRGKIYRPDRVMIQGERAVVVDYKFGLTDSAKYERQISHYAQLLNQMGYTQVDGYIWYIATGQLHKVV